MERVDYQQHLVQDLVTWERNGELNLSPWYQRRSVWTRPQQSYLINTLIEQKPIPTLYFRHVVDLDADRTKREVVDGQQRIRAILGFLDGGFSTRHPKYQRRVYYGELTKDQKRVFRETSLSGGWLLGATEQDVIEIFGRLNSVSKTVNSSEKRNAKFSGEFKQFCLTQAASRLQIWRGLNVFTANDIARMNEVQFIADLLYNFSNGLSDYNSKKLDDFYAENDEDFPKEQEMTKRLDRCFESIVRLPRQTIADTIFRRPPLFFSLIYALDSCQKIPRTSNLQIGLTEIDARFDSDIEPSRRPKEDLDFGKACSASTQRLANRKIRHKYILSFF